MPIDNNNGNDNTFNLFLSQLQKSQDSLSMQVRETLKGINEVKIDLSSVTNQLNSLTRDSNRKSQELRNNSKAIITMQNTLAKLHTRVDDLKDSVEGIEKNADKWEGMLSDIREERENNKNIRKQFISNFVDKSSGMIITVLLTAIALLFTFRKPLLSDTFNFDIPQGIPQQNQNNSTQNSP